MQTTSPKAKVFMWLWANHPEALVKIMQGVARVQEARRRWTP
jgi:hypothetical protein